ncbi:response regulator receiver protein [Ventosimonas gracilis]|uniref:Response regulator receiver protein n=1 Tax=Ventosimonas gracilis TaxID=1680762 RepID=A0A139SRV2_9GAMM|nr:ANTAR domain-containing protein [Ventosimonas gracilis]KXU37262.1 response regulator receiver protein [Ventosimonas gracilis]
MDHAIRRLFEDLRSIRVALIYPPGEDRELLAAQLRRIGCAAQLYWPFPASVPKADLVFFALAQGQYESALWSASEVSATLIALSEYETPTSLKQLLKSQAHGVLIKPFRSAGILSTLVLARSAKQYQDRQQHKIEKLEETIKSRRLIERATRLLMEREQLDEPAAYAHLRSQATRLRVSVAEVAAMLVEASDTLAKLGLAENNRR